MLPALLVFHTRSVLPSKLAYKPPPSPSPLIPITAWALYLFGADMPFWDTCELCKTHTHTKPFV